MLEGVSEELCIDESRIYAAGLSMGGFMSSLVACEMSGRFAAVAPVAGLQFPDGCDPGRPIPVLSFHGTADPILLFNGGVNTDALRPVLGGDGPTTTSTSVPTELDGEGYPEAARDWAEQNGCEGSTDEDVSEEVILRTLRLPGRRRRRVLHRRGRRPLLAGQRVQQVHREHRRPHDVRHRRDRSHLDVLPEVPPAVVSEADERRAPGRRYWLRRAAVVVGRRSG